MKVKDCKGNTIGVYPGTFNPFTNGHLTVVQKALTLFDRVVILFATNPGKSDRLVSQETMMKWTQQYMELHVSPRVSVEQTSGFVASWCEDNNGTHIIRGLRNETDYSYEENIAKVNKEISPGIETVYIRSDNDVISSSMIRLFVSLGKDVTKYVPKTIAMRLNRLEVKS